MRPSKDLRNNQLMRKEGHNLMHKAERKYQVGPVADEEQEKQRQLEGILNKLTPLNFENLLGQIKSIYIGNAVTLIGVVSQIFDKVLMEPTFGEMYAELCFHLSGALPDFIVNGKKITFRRLLLNKCQEVFERGEKEEEERQEKRLKIRRRRLCNIRLIGELYKKRMLPEKIIHACIQKLLGYDLEVPHEENIEALCKLMSTIGVKMDHHRNKVYMDAYFERMKMLSCKQELSSRARFMLINTIDLRKNKWQEGVKVEAPIPDTVKSVAETAKMLTGIQPATVTVDVNGFDVLSSQVESVKLIFERRHPNIAVEFNAKNQHLRNVCMNFLIGILETLCQSLDKLSNEDLVEADIALTYLKNTGFKVDWLEKKLDQLKDKKEEEQLCLARLQEIEENLQKLKHKCSKLHVLAEEEKADLLAVRTALSFDHLV